MRLIAKGDWADQLVIAEPFEVPGCDDKFAVHRALGKDIEALGPWSATHVETGMRVSSGDTLAEAVENCCNLWLSKTPDQRARAVILGKQILEDRGELEVIQ